MVLYMVRKIKIVEVYEQQEEAEAEEPNEQTNEQTNEEEEVVEEPETQEPATEEATEEPEEMVATKPAKRMLPEMAVTEKVLQQVECQACGRKMSAKVLKYSHARYCSARDPEEQPEDIPIPQLKIKKGEHLTNKISLPVKHLKLKTKKAEVVTEVKPTPIPIQTLEMDQSFHYKMTLRHNQKREQYQAMMSNAF
jgi:hypothetical protein